MKNLFKSVIISTLVFSTLVFSTLVSSTSAFANTYTVKYGDEFLGIALRHGLTQTQLQNLNPNVDIEKLKAGTQLEIGNAKPVNRATTQQPITSSTQQKATSTQTQSVQQQQYVQNAVILERVQQVPQYQPIQQPVVQQPVVQQPIQYQQYQIPQYQTVQPQYAPSGRLVIIDGQTYIVQPVQNIR